MYLSSLSGIIDISDNESVLTRKLPLPHAQKNMDFLFWLKALTSVAKVFFVCVWILLIKLAVDHQASDCNYLVFLYTHISRQ